MRTPAKPPTTRPDAPNNELACVIERAVLSVYTSADSDRTSQSGTNSVDIGLDRTC
jgi:hypothetical protein